MIYAPVKIGGIVFQHVMTDEVESYHYSGNNFFWEIFRHRRGGGRITVEWFAIAFKKGSNQPTTLNMAIGDGKGGYTNKDRLFDVDAEDPRKLLAALVGLIKEEGDGPKYEKRRRGEQTATACLPF